MYLIGFSSATYYPVEIKDLRKEPGYLYFGNYQVKDSVFVTTDLEELLHTMNVLYSTERNNRLKLVHSNYREYTYKLISKLTIKSAVFAFNVLSTSNEVHAINGVENEIEMPFFISTNGVLVRPVVMQKKVFEHGVSRIQRITAEEIAANLTIHDITNHNKNYYPWVSYRDNGWELGEH